MCKVSIEEEDLLELTHTNVLLHDTNKRLAKQNQEKDIDAVVYAHNQKEVLCAFLSHGEMEISNNQVENAIRPFVAGRKGWLFSDTPVAQRQARSSIH